MNRIPRKLGLIALAGAAAAGSVAVASPAGASSAQYVGQYGAYSYAITPQDYTFWNAPARRVRFDLLVPASGDSVCVRVFSWNSGTATEISDTEWRYDKFATTSFINRSHDITVHVTAPTRWGGYWNDVSCQWGTENVVRISANTGANVNLGSLGAWSPTYASPGMPKNPAKPADAPWPSF